MSLDVSGYFGFGTNHLGDFNRGDWTIHEDVTDQRGTHELHFGGDVVRLKNHLVNTFTMSGEFDFTDQLSGDNLTDFMLGRSEEHTSELQSLRHLVCRLLLRQTPPSTLFPYTTLFRSGDFNRGDWTIHEDVTDQRGTHELHFGGDVVRLKNHLVNTFTMSGEFDFTDQLSGDNLTDFMLG